MNWVILSRSIGNEGVRHPGDGESEAAALFGWGEHLSRSVELRSAIYFTIEWSKGMYNKW